MVEHIRLGYALKIDESEPDRRGYEILGDESTLSAKTLLRPLSLIVGVFYDLKEAYGCAQSS